MTDSIEDVRRRMEAAAAGLDFEEAKRLRDILNLLRGGAAPEAVTDLDTSGITRQQPGSMGIGTSRQRVTPPPGWRPPPKPDPMTRGRNRRKTKP
ncbi:MAG: UvrB/UvrC motif-containing protein [Sphingomonadaceae bacterium]|nr:UvrB/UvrC motif-containing protein [Sphingomonadaceae bacterium]